ncbi:MAG: fibronectin type III domain-containing protein [Cyclobacteriaceae bacterium]
MKYLKLIGLLAIGFLYTLDSMSQWQIQTSSLQTNAPVIYSNTNPPPATGESVISLHSGTFSNRTTDGANNGVLANKTNTFFDMTSYDTKYYGGNISKPGYAEGHLSYGPGYYFRMNYRLQFPVGYNQSDSYKYPLIVMMHGGGERGDCWGGGCFSNYYIQLSQAGSVTSGLKVLNSSTATFLPTDINKEIQVNNSGPSNSTLITTITAVNSATQVVLYDNASSTGGSRTFKYHQSIKTLKNGGSIGSGSTTLTSSVATFVATDVNKVIQINNAGPSSANLVTRISAFTSATQVTLATAASSAVSSKTFSYGYGSEGQFLNNDYNLLHGGQTHMDAVYLANTLRAEDSSLPTRAFPGFVFFPQNENGWDNIDGAYRTLELLIQKYNIDPDRIYIHGLSNGGAGSWAMLNKDPKLFSAILPMSATIAHSSPIFVADVDKTMRIPAWIFQGGVDTSPTPNTTNQIVDKLKAAGGLPRYTIYPTTGHGTWGAAYAEPDFFSWMLKRNKKDIQVLYGDSTICATSGNGAKLTLGTGFLAYQWELDGTIIPGATTDTYIATQPGIYRARFSRISSTPIETEWNGWSKPVTIREIPAVVPTITPVGSVHLPYLLNGATTVRLNGPTKKDLVKLWFKNGTQTTSYNTITKSYVAPYTDTAYNVLASVGLYKLKTIQGNACSSLDSNPIQVTLNATTSLTAPVGPTAQAIAPGTIQLFWTDNTPNETGFEVYRSSTSASGPFNFFKLLPADAISYVDTGLAPNITYYYKLRAVNNTLVSLYSDVSISTLPANQPPSAPQNLVVTSRTLSTITLSWTTSTDDIGVTGYNIYYGSTTVPTNSTATSYTLTGLSANSNYLITVKAIDTGSILSQPSNQLATSTYFSGLNYSYTAVVLENLTQAENNWNTPERTGTCSNFDIGLRQQDDYFNFKFDGYIYITTGGSYQFSTTSDDGSMLFLKGPFILTPSPDFTTNKIVDNDGLHGDRTITSTSQSLVSNTAYPITCLFFEKDGGQNLVVEYKGPDTNNNWVIIPTSVLNSGSAPTLTPPLAPTGLLATTSGMTSINLNWNVALATDSYEIYRSIGNSTTYSIIATVATNSFVDTGLLPGTQYNYKLKSVSNTNGSSVAFSSPIASASTDPDSQKPDAPAPVSIVSWNYTNASFQWVAPFDNVAVTGYYVYANGSLLGTSTTTTYYTTVLSPATIYNITVKAYDAVGNISDPSTPTILTTLGPSTFFSKPLSTDLSSLNSWSDAPDGMGNLPSDFSFNGQYFIIQNPQTLTSALTIGGNISRVIVQDNVTLTVTQPLTGTLKVGNGSSVNINVDYQPTFETISPTSTVSYNTYSSVPLASYGNLILNGSGSGLKNIAAGNLTVQGNLTLANGIGLKGASSNGTVVSVAGDLIVTGTPAKPSADNRVALQFAGTSPHNMTVASDQFFYKITTNAASTTVTFNNTSGSPKTLSLGSSNGGGLDLATGSTLVVGNNTLALTDKSTVNPSTNTGEISITNGNIQFTTSATTANNFYFTTGSNKVQNLTMQTVGTTTIQKAVEIYDGLKINGGILNANGNITIKSGPSASAAIQQITSGSITGNVKVERYMDTKEDWRYLSSPVAGVKVADWQLFIPITGNFPETSTGPGLTNAASMYYYNTQYIAYPVSSNQEIIQKGVGYATYMYNGASGPTNLISTGVPHQGTVNFTITGGSSDPEIGWNLLGNPYASDIVWNNNSADWPSSNISDMISVRKNNGAGGYEWMTWNRSANIGTLPNNGQIPSGQAFWVKAIAGSASLSVNESAKTTLSSTNNNWFYRSGSQVNDFSFSIKIDDGHKQDYAYVMVTDNGSPGYDEIKDGVKKLNSFFNLSTSSSDGIRLVFNDVGNNFCERTIPINLLPGEVITELAHGTYTLSFSNLDNFSLANVQLIDAFLNTTTSINMNSAPYSVVVTSDPASYTNRLSLKLTRPTVITNNAVLSDKDIYCRSEQNAIVSIQNSQTGVNYEATDATSSILSEKVVGTGETIQLVVPIKNLLASQTIKINSYFPGCSASPLANSKTITISELPILNVTTEIAACIGGTVDVIATGTGKAYQWYNRNIDLTMGETGNSLRVSVVDPIHSYRVTSISDKGCKSESKDFFVRADSLEIPNIKLSDNGILETDGTKGVQWLLNKNIISGANAAQFKPEQSGSYSVRTNNVYCVQESLPVEYVVTGLEGNSTEQFTVVVYPNPSEKGGKFTVIGSSPISTQLQLNITDLLGKELLTLTLSSEEYSKGVALESNLSGGVYIVRVTQNGMNVHQKIVIR